MTCIYPGGPHPGAFVSIFDSFTDICYCTSVRSVLRRYDWSSFLWKFMDLVRLGLYTSRRRTRPISYQYGPKKDLLLWLFTNLRTAKCISMGKRALQRRKKATNDFHNVIFARGFCQVIGNKARTRFRVYTRFSEIFS